MNNGARPQLNDDLLPATNLGARCDEGEQKCRKERVGAHIVQRFTEITSEFQERGD
jgi:hypothetical protein